MTSMAFDAATPPRNRKGALLPVLDALLAWGRDWAVSPDDPDLTRYRTVLRPQEDR